MSKKYDATGRELVWTENTEAGEIAAVYAGFGTPPANDEVYWSRTGNQVTVYLRADAVATSDATTFSFGTLPTDIRPAHAKIVPVGQMEDDGELVPASALVDTDGSVTFLRTYYNGATVVTEAVWSNGGSKGWREGASFTYDLD